MAGRRGLVALASAGFSAALCLATAPAHAQASGAHFGERGAFLFTVERVFGFQNQQFSEDGGSIDSTGYQPFFWGGVGLFGMSASGLSFGALLGLIRWEDDDGDAVSVVQARPRIGYGGTEQQGRFGYWVRGGPTLIYSHRESFDALASALGAEAYAVFFPARHVGILVGPHAEFNLAGTGDGDPYFKSVGLTAGILGEFD